MAQPNRRNAVEDPVDLDAGRMSFLEHLDELRTRLIRSLMALGFGMLVSFLFIDRIADLVLSAMLSSLPLGGTLILTKPGEGFAFYLDLSLMGGVVVAAPFMTYQAWRFIAPGLYSREKRLMIPFVLFAVTGSIAGALFSHLVLFPSMMAFFSSFDSTRMRFMPRVEDTFALYKNMLIGMVVVFQIPTLTFVLARMGLVSAAWLIRSLKFAVLGSVIVSAVLTPSSDPWNQLVFAAPLLGMYLVGIGVAWVCRSGAARSDADSGSALRLVVAASVLERAHRQHARSGIRLVHGGRG
jgi:sec-independent protein translocase protein TatC